MPTHGGGVLVQDRDVHLQMCRERLDEWRAFVDRLKVRSEALSGEERTKMREAIVDLEHTIEDGEECVSNTEEIDSGAWAAAKRDAQAAWDMVETAFKKQAEVYMG
jgi:nitrogen fixation protein FixH